MGALRRYRQVFQLGDIPGGAKEDLLPAIQRHFALQVLCKAATSMLCCMTGNMSYALMQLRPSAADMGLWAAGGG